MTHLKAEGLSSLRTAVWGHRSTHSTPFVSCHSPWHGPTLTRGIPVQSQSNPHIHFCCHFVLVSHVSCLCLTPCYYVQNCFWIIFSQSDSWVLSGVVDPGNCGSWAKHQFWRYHDECVCDDLESGTLQRNSTLLCINPFLELYSWRRGQR